MRSAAPGWRRWSWRRPAKTRPGVKAPSMCAFHRPVRFHGRPRRRRPPSGSPSKCSALALHLHGKPPARCVDAGPAVQLAFGSVLRARSEAPAPVRAGWRVLVPRSGLRRAQTIVREATAKKPVFPSGLQVNTDVLSTLVARPTLPNCKLTSMLAQRVAALLLVACALAIGCGLRVPHTTLPCRLRARRARVACAAAAT